MFGSGFGLELEWLKVFLAKLPALCGARRECVEAVEKGVAMSGSGRSTGAGIRRRVPVPRVLFPIRKTRPYTLFCPLQDLCCGAALAAPLRYIVIYGLHCWCI